MSKTFYKVLFGIWLTFTFVWLCIFVGGIVKWEFDFDDLIIAMCGVVVCQLYWELWHRPTVEKKEYIIINFDTGRIIGDSMFDADEFSKELNRYYEHKMMHEMNIVDAAPFINIKED